MSADGSIPVLTVYYVWVPLWQLTLYYTMSSAVIINMQSSVVRRFGVAYGETKAPYDMLDNRGIASFYMEPFSCHRPKRS